MKLSKKIRWSDGFVEESEHLDCEPLKPKVPDCEPLKPKVNMNDGSGRLPYPRCARYHFG